MVGGSRNMSPALLIKYKIKTVIVDKVPIQSTHWLEKKQIFIIFLIVIYDFNRAYLSE